MHTVQANWTASIALLGQNPKVKFSSYPKMSACSESEVFQIYLKFVTHTLLKFFTENFVQIEL